MDFLQFFGSYWWLIFPIAGVLSGFGRAWQKSLERSHKRRLETLRLKGELRTAQLAAKAGPATAPVEVAASTDPGRLVRLLAAHDDINRRWLDYELDVARLIAFPAMSDGRQPLTAAFLRAKKVADALRPESARVRLDTETMNEYRDAVHDYEVAFEIAEHDARRLKDSAFDPAERKRLDTAQQLLNVAVDQAATAAERQLAYRRVRQELDGLIALSDGAIDVLESKVALQLGAGAGTSASATPAATPAAANAGQPQPQPVPIPVAKPAATPAASAQWPIPSRVERTDDAPRHEEGGTAAEAAAPPHHDKP